MSDLTGPINPRTAEVIARWGDDTALVRTAEGAAIEVPVPEELRAHVDVGTRVALNGDRVIDWGAGPIVRGAR